MMAPRLPAHRDVNSSKQVLQETCTWLTFMVDFWALLRRSTFSFRSLAGEHAENRMGEGEDRAQSSQCVFVWRCASVRGGWGCPGVPQRRGSVSPARFWGDFASFWRAVSVRRCHSAPWRAGRLWRAWLRGARSVPVIRLEGSSHGASRWDGAAGVPGEPCCHLNSTVTVRKKRVGSPRAQPKAALTATSQHNFNRKHRPNLLSAHSSSRRCYCCCSGSRDASRRVRKCTTQVSELLAEISKFTHRFWGVCGEICGLKIYCHWFSQGNTA